MKFSDFSLTFLVFKISLTNLQNSPTFPWPWRKIKFPWPVATLNYQYSAPPPCTHRQGERLDYPGEWDNFEKLVSDFLPMGRYFVSKIPWMGIKTSLCFLLEFPAITYLKLHPCQGVLTNSKGFGLFGCLIPRVSPPLPVPGKTLIGA